MCVRVCIERFFPTYVLYVFRIATRRRRPSTHPLQWLRTHACTLSCLLLDAGASKRASPFFIHKTRAVSIVPLDNSSWQRAAMHSNDVRILAIAIYVRCVQYGSSSTHLCLYVLTCTLDWLLFEAASETDIAVDPLVRPPPGVAPLPPGNLFFEFASSTLAIRE